MFWHTSCHVVTFIEGSWLTYNLLDWDIGWAWLLVKVLRIFQYMNPFNCIIWRHKFHQGLHKFVVMFRKVCKKFRNFQIESWNSSAKTSRNAKLGLTWVYWCSHGSGRTLNCRRSWIYSYIGKFWTTCWKPASLPFTRSEWEEEHQSRDGQ